MTNEITKPGFDYSLVTEAQKVQLKTIATRLQVRVQRTAEEMLAMGADLREAKRVCKEDGKLFTEWCESAECPVSYITATRLISVESELGNKNNLHVISNIAFGVLSAVTQTRDEDIRTALLEHIEKEAGDGKQVTQKEITALKKALREAQDAAKAQEERVFDAQAALQGYIAERQAADEEARIAKEEAKAARAARDKVIHELMDKEAERRKLEARIKGHQQAMADAEAVYREQLEEMRARIVAEERARPRTDAELAEQQKKLQALREEETRLAQGLARQRLEHEHAKEALRDTRVAVQLRDAVLSDFSKAAQQFRQTCLLLGGAADALRQIPMTEELYAQVEMVRKLSLEVADNLKDALSV